MDQPTERPVSVIEDVQETLLPWIRETDGSGYHILVGLMDADDYTMWGMGTPCCGLNSSHGFLFYPNDIETFTVPSESKRNILLLHELGHALGLLHGHGTVFGSENEKEYSVMMTDEYAVGNGYNLFRDPVPQGSARREVLNPELSDRNLFY